MNNKKTRTSQDNMQFCYWSLDPRPSILHHPLRSFQGSRVSLNHLSSPKAHKRSILASLIWLIISVVEVKLNPLHTSRSLPQAWDLTLLGIKPNQIQMDINDSTFHPIFSLGAQNQIWTISYTDTHINSHI